MTRAMTSPDDQFLTTRWTQVLAAGADSPAARDALSDLCAAYYAPVHAYIDRTSHDLGDARDLTHEFFARLLAGKVLAGADREKGRFRELVKAHIRQTVSSEDELRDELRYLITVASS